MKIINIKLSIIIDNEFRIHLNQHFEYKVPHSILIRLYQLRKDLWFKIDFSTPIEEQLGMKINELNGQKNNI